VYLVDFLVQLNYTGTARLEVKESGDG
jgi:hypothetical protein